jgi:hypothetical protein
MPADTPDTALIMAADTISGYIQALLDGIQFKQTAYAMDRDSRKAALARFLKRASGADAEGEEEHRLAAEGDQSVDSDVVAWLIAKVRAAF